MKLQSKIGNRKSAVLLFSVSLCLCVLAGRYAAAPEPPRFAVMRIAAHGHGDFAVMPPAPQHTPTDANQVLASVFNSSLNALNVASGSFSGGGSASDANQVLHSVYSSSSNALQVNCVAGCGLSGLTGGSAGESVYFTGSTAAWSWSIPQFMPYSPTLSAMSPSTSAINECTVLAVGEVESAVTCLSLVPQASQSILLIHERNCSDDLTQDIFSNGGKPFVWFDDSFCPSNSNVTIEVAQHIQAGEFWTCGYGLGIGAAGASPCYVKPGASFPAFVTSPSSLVTVNTVNSSSNCSPDGSLNGDYVSGGFTYVNANGSTDEPDSTVGVTSGTLSASQCATVTTPASLPAGVSSFNIYFGYSGSSTALKHGQTFWSFNTTATNRTFYFSSTTQPGFATGVPPPEENETGAMFMLGPVYPKNSSAINIGGAIAGMTIDCSSLTGSIGLVVSTVQEHGLASHLNVDNCEGAASVLFDGTNGILGQVSSYIDDILIGNTSGVNVSTTKAGIEFAAVKEVHGSGRIDVATWDNNSASVPSGWTALLASGPVNTINPNGTAQPSDSTIHLDSFHDEGFGGGGAKFNCIILQSNFSLTVDSLTCVANVPTGSPSNAEILLQSGTDIDISSAWFTPNTYPVYNGNDGGSYPVPTSGSSSVLEHITHASFGAQANSWAWLDNTQGSQGAALPAGVSGGVLAWTGSLWAGSASPTLGVQGATAGVLTVAGKSGTNGSLVLNGGTSGSVTLASNSTGSAMTLSGNLSLPAGGVISSADTSNPSITFGTSAITLNNGAAAANNYLDFNSVPIVSCTAAGACTFTSAVSGQSTTISAPGAGAVNISSGSGNILLNAKATISTNGIFTKYNNTSTSGNGLAYEVANNATSASNTGSATQNLLGSTASGGLYRVSIYAYESAAGSGGTCTTAGSVVLNLRWTDSNSQVENDGTQTLSLPAAIGANFVEDHRLILAKVSTAIVLVEGAYTNGNCTTQPMYVVDYVVEGPL